jgi:hypothetical protein
VLHDPRDERFDLLCGNGAGAEKERVVLLPLVLLGVDVERPASTTVGLLMASRVELKMPPRTRSTWSSCTSFLAALAACRSSLELSLMSSST